MIMLLNISFITAGDIMSFFLDILLIAGYRPYFLVIITSAEEGGYAFGAVCLSVCLSGCPSITRKLVNGF